MVYILKKSLKETRPDGTAYSFPSGHTANAFAGATMLSIEYGEQHKWVPYVAYGTATAVGVMRMANNETGRAFLNTKLKIYEYVRGKEVLINSVTTDENGAFRFPKTQNTDYYRNFLLNIDGTNNYILYNKKFHRTELKEL